MKMISWLDHAISSSFLDCIKRYTYFLVEPVNQVLGKVKIPTRYKIKLSHTQNNLLRAVHRLVPLFGRARREHHLAGRLRLQWPPCGRSPNKQRWVPGRNPATDSAVLARRSGTPAGIFGHLQGPATHCVFLEKDFWHNKDKFIIIVKNVVDKKNSSSMPEKLNLLACFWGHTCMDGKFSNERSRKVTRRIISYEISLNDSEKLYQFILFVYFS